MENSDFFSPAIALWHHRQMLGDARDRLKALADIIDWSNDLELYVWGQWFTTALEFRPDLIIELGRGHGNSTCVFTDAAHYLAHCQVVSLCLDNIWATSKHPLIETVVPSEWFTPLDARVENILEVDFKRLLEGKQRVLLLWDAHGFEIAGMVLGRVLPLLQQCQHLVIMHDISDSRYTKPDLRYQGQGLWHGESGQSERMFLGYLDSAVAQVISILDFTTRNQLTLHSADHSFHTELSAAQVETLRQELGPEWVALNGHWFWFSLNELPPDAVVHFPTYVPGSTVTARLHTLEAQLAAERSFNEQEVTRQLQAFSAERQSYQVLVEQLKSRIAAMESSKFWKLRSTWLSLKQWLRRTTE